jgi:hypothetical protein
MDALELREVDRLVVGDDDVLVRVHAVRRFSPARQLPMMRANSPPISSCGVRRQHQPGDRMTV